LTSEIVNWVEYLLY